MAKRGILFVCTGNVCRSPMAEYLLRGRLSAGEWDVASAGTSAAYGSPASEEAITAMREKGIDLCPHRSQPVSRQLVDAASVVVVMTGTHFDQVSRLFPHAREKLFLLKSFDARASGGDVADPLGASVEEYRNVRDEIDAALDGFVAFIQCLE